MVGWGGACRPLVATGEPCKQYESRSGSDVPDSPMDYTVHGILMARIQARILEWVADPFSRDLPNSGTKPRSPTLGLPGSSAGKEST